MKSFYSLYELFYFKKFVFKLIKHFDFFNIFLSSFMIEFFKLININIYNINFIEN